VSGGRYDAQDTKHIAEGRHGEVLATRAAYARQEVGAGPSFLRFVVLDVINDPDVVDRAKLSYYEHELGVSNLGYAAVAPRNSIIARRVMGGDSGASEKVMVLYPFFPPHLSMPAKPGEHVWGMFEHPDAKVNELGYWMCRIVQPAFVEDVNYTHADRQFDSSFMPGLSAAFDGPPEPKYEFRNGAVDDKGGERYTVAGTTSLPSDERAYEKLLTASDAARISTYEAVSRYRKRPADMALEGSNNTLIVLGTDRTGPAATYDAPGPTGRVPSPPAGDDDGPGAGSIDLVAGRGQTPATGGKAVKNVVGFEVGKSRAELAEHEGDVDLRNDRSRVLIAQRTRPDVNFGVGAVVHAHAANPSVDDGSGEGAIVIKTDKVRLLARHDVVILVTGATGIDAAGNVQEPSNDPADCASIILRTNGDIIFTPARAGVVRLGGEDADLAPLCTRVNNAGAGGQVAAQPIVDTMGGAQGAADGLNGTFARKILIK